MSIPGSGYSNSKGTEVGKQERFLGNSTAILPKCKLYVLGRGQ